jgi:uracil-DNA glycosylase
MSKNDSFRYIKFYNYINLFLLLLNKNKLLLLYYISVDLINKVTILKEIKTNVVHCTLCKLCYGRKNAVPGCGNLNTKILFVGEAPGKTEDKIGLPFIGFAGKILEESLEKAGLNRADVYITNVVKCRPPNNRVPDKDEIFTCLQYLKREIQIISPSIVCILGATALKSLLNLNSLQSYHGKIIICDKIKYFITYHPAATIYNNTLRELFFNEINMVVNMVKK